MSAALRRAALRAAKTIDFHVTHDDELLSAVESAYANGTDDDLADAVMRIVTDASVLDPRYVVMAELFAWRFKDRIEGTATDPATLRLRDIADQVMGSRDPAATDLTMPTPPKERS